MAAADVMRLDAAPTRRQDIISQILSDYGDSRDPAAAADDDDDDDDVDLDDYYTQTELSPAAAAAPPVQSAPVSPVGRDKPLAPLVGFRLRVADAPAASHRGSPAGNTRDPTMLLSSARSLSFRGRRPKPPDLKLARSNGSTAAATPAKTDTSSPLPSLTLSAPNLQHLPTPDRARAHQSARLREELPLPPTPPLPPAKTDLPRPSDPSTNAAGAPTMGNKASKAAGDQTSPSQRSKFSLRRKPVKRDSPPPAPQSNGAPIAPAQGHAAPGAPAGAAQAQLQAEAPTPAVHISKPNAPLHQPVTLPQSSAPHSEGNTLVEPNRNSRSVSTTLSEATAVRDRSNSPPTEPDDEEPITPTLKPAAVDLLPSPSPVPEESPSKYGLIKKPSDATMKEQKVAMHYRGKSSTGFDIFKSSTNKLQNTKPYKPTLSPPTSPNPASVSNTPTPAPASPPATSPTELSSPTLTSPSAPIFQLFNTQMRPERTMTPRLNCVHIQCFHNHRRFHRSNNRVLPVGCMLCFSASTDFHWTCTWCALRICQGCRARLESIPRKSLEVLIKEKMDQNSMDEKAVAGAGGTRNKENLMVKKTRRSINEPNKVVVWEA
ncbi:hypothetical protein MPH_08856 [Macrophomina phaseolina MS6]|uniref:Uncharacterized protein n=1 Tax=Macrophomina phaseolina (strain MS6) TaxID=1126212 RepID=K2RMG3_MACPH|nr:hypothetical protein MPH_08856 [Macrophomina phaseolina MS6]